MTLFWTDVVCPVKHQPMIHRILPTKADAVWRVPCLMPLCQSSDYSLVAGLQPAPMISFWLEGKHRDMKRKGTHRELD